MNHNSIWLISLLEKEKRQKDRDTGDKALCEGDRNQSSGTASQGMPRTTGRLP